jgi:hypothetical protein
VRQFVTIAVLAGAIASAQTPLDPIAAAVNPAVDVKRAMETMNRVYSTDRWFTFPKFEETAAWLKQRLEQSGLHDVEIGGGIADGKTQAGFWTMPLAWDVKSARLEMIEPEREVLCDYNAVPASLGMWSGPTPAGGIDADVVDIARTSWQDVKGRLVLTDRNSSEYKSKLVQYGALGAINGFSENPALKNGRQWINAWGDDGWAFTKTSTPLLSFSVTPLQAAYLREMLASGKKVRVHAVADTRYYEGRYPWVTGVLPGQSTDEEVLVLGHTSEQGAQDNATGVAAMVEALNTLSRLIRSGTLPQPRRSIRILLMPEMYGSLSYIASHPERMRRTIAAMTVDTPAASFNLPGTEYTFYLNPQVATSYTDALVLRIAAACLSPGRPWHWKEQTPGTDSYLGDPTINVPDVWPYSGSGIVTHHNSEDKPGDVDPRSMRDLTAVIATYLYFNAAAGPREVPWLAAITVARGREQVAASPNRASYYADRTQQALLAILRLAPGARNLIEPALAQVDQFREAEHIVVRRKRIGSIPLDDLPRDQWEGYPSGAWDKTVTFALYWCDGKRNLAEVIRLTELELGPTNFDFVGYFRFLERHGYVEFVR